MTNNVVDVTQGSQYYIQDGQGTNRMVSPAQLLPTLEKMVNQNNLKKIVVTMYLKIEREVKIIGDTRYFEYLTRNEPGAKFVMEKHDIIHDTLRFNPEANALVGTKGRILMQDLLHNREVEKVTEKIETLSLETNNVPVKKVNINILSMKDMDDITDTLKSISLNKDKKNKPTKSIQQEIDDDNKVLQEQFSNSISQLVNDLTKNVMDSTITKFIQDFIDNNEKITNKLIFSMILECLHKNGWHNSGGFDSPPNKQQLINDLCNLLEQSVTQIKNEKSLPYSI